MHYLRLEPEWRNWQTRRIQNPVPVKGVWVRVPSSVLHCPNGQLPYHSTMLTIGVIIPAAGQSQRFGNKDKLAADFGGRPLLLRTVEFFAKREEVKEIVVVGPPARIEAFTETFGPALSFHGVLIVAGSEIDRWESVKLAIQRISDDVDRIAVHDAARPALSNTLFERLVLASNSFDAVAAALPITGTVKRVDAMPTTISDHDAIADAILGESTQATVTAHSVEETICRDRLWELQTPQIFEPSLLRRAYEEENLSGVTDDAEVIEKLGEPIHLIEGDSRNIKVTTPDDLNNLKAMLGIKGERARPVHKRF